MKDEPSAPTQAEPGAVVPFPRIDRPDPGVRGGIPVGALLERARRRLGYSSEAVCQALWLSDIELDHYESGVRQPSPNIVAALAEFYGIDHERFGAGAHADLRRSGNRANRDLLWLGWAAVDLTEADGTVEFVVRGIAQTLRSMRSLSETDPISIRNEELVTIGSAIDLEAEGLPAALQKWFRLSEAEVSQLIARLHDAVATPEQSPSA